MEVASSVAKAEPALRSRAPSPLRDPAWDLFTPQPGIWYRWRLDGAEVCLWNQGDEWRVVDRPRSLRTHATNFGGPEELIPEPTDYRSCFAPAQRVGLKPTMLDRPLVIQNDSVITVHRDQEAVFEVDLPISVRFELESGLVLSGLNTILLTKTWFGDSTSGIPCFLWPVRLRALLPEPCGTLVRCRIRVKNETKSPLNLRQFVIDTDLLSLWTGDRVLSTNKILLEGQADGSLRMAALPIDADPNSILYQAPVGQTERLIKRGVDFLRNIAGIS